MSKRIWSTEKWNTVNKVTMLFGPEGFEAEIDYDDVDHGTVRRVAKKMLRILNEHWHEDQEGG